MKPYLDTAIKAAEKRNHAEPGDYINEADGLLYCGKCHTPRQCRVLAPMRGMVTCFCLCKCRGERRMAEDAAEKERRHLEYLRSLKANGLQDKTLRDWTFKNDNGTNPQKTKQAKRYVEQWEQMKADNIGLLLLGEVGTGKTYFAASIANALLDSGVPVLMTNFAKILNSLSALYSTERNAFIDSLNHFHLLIIDDFGMERGTEYALEQVYQVIDGRYRCGRPLIVTTNLSLAQMKSKRIDMAYQRIYSRVLQMCVPITFVGADLRVNASKNKIALATALLEKAAAKGDE